MREFVKCWNCKKEQYLEDNNICRKCGSYMELQKETKDLRPLQSTPLEVKYPETKHQLPKGFGGSTEQTMQEVHCYDCLKTKGFSTTVTLVALGVILTVALATGYIIIPENFPIVVLFLVFWIAVVGIGGMFVPSYIAAKAIRDYCNKSKPDDYKVTSNVIIFGMCTAFALIVMVLTVLNVSHNYDWWIVRDCNGISYCN